MGEDYRLESDYGKIENWSGYECVLSDDITEMKLYKRINPAKLTPLTDTIIENVESKDLYIPLFDYFSDDYLNANSLKMVLECDAEVDQGNLSISLVQVLSDLEGKTIDYGSTVFDRYFGHRKHYKFHFVRKITNDFLADKSLNLYFYNPELIQLKINRIRIRIYSCEMQ